VKYLQPLIFPLSEINSSFLVFLILEQSLDKLASRVFLLLGGASSSGEAASLIDMNKVAAIKINSPAISS
jgi:hypothetical protein